jgi:hypothetical protein
MRIPLSWHENGCLSSEEQKFFASFFQKRRFFSGNVAQTAAHPIG